ncbi:MAG: hypothetical protein U0872_12305 [Planctomycetaceae bacterium]
MFRRILRQFHAVSHRDRRGSTLLIVMVLLGMLSLLGFLFYTFAAQERSTAAYFADANKVYTAELDADALLNYGLEQLIVGPKASVLPQSALAGDIPTTAPAFGPHAMLTNMFGWDVNPYNGSGIHLSSTNGLPIVDMDFDSTGDSVAANTPLGQAPLNINASAVASADTRFARNMSDPTNSYNANTYQAWPDPGVNYTYPDINNLFLAYKGTAIDDYGNPVQVIIPSFHRPQLLRDAGGMPDSNWFNASALHPGRVLRPHPSQLNADGTTPRFPTAVTGTLTSTFPFQQGTGSLQGVWSLTSPYIFGSTTVPAYEYDVDNDNDGVKEGIWLDLQYPVQTDPSGQKYVPLFSYTVYDADGLLNLNAHGNLARLGQVTPSQLSGISSFNKFLSGSNQGLGPAEINPQYALNAVPDVTAANGGTGDLNGTASDLTAALQQHQYEFGTQPGNAQQLSNMEWYRLLTGTANFQSTTTFNDLYAGRYGEASTVLYQGLTTVVSNGYNVSTTPLNQMPFPGITGTDDNWNRYEGQAAWESRSATPGYNLASGVYQYNASYTPQFYPANLVAFYAPYPYGQPLDFTGDGTIVAGNYGKNRAFTSVGATGYSTGNGSGYMKYSQYMNYDNSGGLATYLAAGTYDFTNVNSVDAGWQPDSLLGMQMVDSSGNPQLSLGNPGPLGSMQIDEDLETIVDPANASSSDSILGLDENAALQLSASDLSALSLGSRAKTLAPFNFSTNVRASEISKRFATSSWDRKQFGYAGAASDSNYNFHLPAYSGGYNGDGVVRRPWELSDLLDANGNLNPDGKRETFPPAIYDTANSVYAISTNSSLSLTERALDPFRYPVRRLLSASVGNLNFAKPQQFRLSLNHLTTTDLATNSVHQTTTDASEFNSTGTANVIQRGLTPHDPNLSNTVVTTATSPQEVKARLDRQQMARDIYVMLYMLGGGIDFVTQNNLTGTQVGILGYTNDNAPVAGNRPLYNDRQLREMAQFAVNTVDALDPDHVMTKFEYDKNLGNGWNLDDNPYGNDSYTPYGTTNTNYNADYPEDSDERGVVFGVEAQQMTISEVLAFQAPQILNAGTPDDHKATEHNDKFDRYFTYVELRNISSQTVDFSNYQWRLRSAPRDVTGTKKNERWVVFQGGTVPADTVFTLGNAGETDAGVPAAPNYSRFKCANSNFSTTNYQPTTMEFNDPSKKLWIAPNAAALDLDLLADRDQMSAYKFQLVDQGMSLINATTGMHDVTDDQDVTNATKSADGAGRFYNEASVVNLASLPQERPTFILERRQYPDRRPPTFQSQTEEDDNPWIPVDRVVLTNGLTKFGLQWADTDPPSQIDPRLKQLMSWERPEPLNLAASVSHANDIVANSLMAENSTSTKPFNIWQVTYNRPFASPIELLQVPVYGPVNVTRWAGEFTQPPFAQTTTMQTASITPPEGVAATSIPYAATASGKILQPEDITNLQTAPGMKSPANDNRWYRLLEFFEVPTRTHRQLGDPLDIMRQPGKLNLNTLRYPDVLAGLVDDVDVLGFGGYQTNRSILYALDTGDADPLMSAAPGPAANVRDWWVQLLKARDGRLVLSPSNPSDGSTRIVADNVTGLFLPGLADSNPFRGQGSLDFTTVSGLRQSPGDALESTIFRKIPIDAGSYVWSASTDVPPVTGSSTLPLTADQRHLWEVGNSTEHSGGLDGVMRHRLLSKIYNNTTTRSHVFLVFMTVQFFQADDTTQPSTTLPDGTVVPNVMIGGPITNTPTYRGFFVVDRSQPEDAYDGSTGKFTNYQALVKYRLRLP